MKRLIIAQIKIELDDSTDYGKANIQYRHWADVVADYLCASNHKIRQYCSIEIDETKANKPEAGDSQAVNDYVDPRD